MNDDVTVKQTEQFLKDLPQTAVSAEEAALPIVNAIIKQLAIAMPQNHPQLDVMISKFYAAEQAINANAQAVANLTNQVAPLLTPLQGVRLQGSGTILNTVNHIPNGLRTSMTTHQHALHVIAGILQIVFLAAGILISAVPSIGSYGIGGGLTLVALISGIKNLVTPYLSTYADADTLVPRAQIVSAGS